ncbi:MAG: ParB/RepB/Spo0J family partition protein [Lachnospiraceae bacterium]|nr:ParB/RepB/Spo0J family partition protein [Lachnospiraceae bacterium]
MATKKTGLGKGLNTMIRDKNPNPAAKVEGEPITTLPISKIEPNKLQPRKTFDEDKLNELADSLKQHGIVEPLVVLKKEGYYMIISGERRWRAARIADIKEVPVVIREGMSDQEVLEISLIENIQREDLNPIEEAITYQRLIKEFNLTQDEVSERVSKSRTAVTNSLRLLKLDDRVQEMIIDGRLSTGHARAILGLKDLEQQFEFAQQCIDHKLSVREVEKEVKRLQKETPEGKKKEKKLNSQTEAIYGDIAENMKKIFGTKVTINAKDENTGKIELEYYSKDELDRIYNLMQSIK